MTNRRNKDSGLIDAVILGAVAALACGCGESDDSINGYVSSYKCEAQEQWRITEPGLRFQSALAYDDGYVVTRGTDASASPTAVVSLDKLGSTKWETDLTQRWGKPFASSFGLVIPGSVGAQPDIEATALSSDGAPLWSATIDIDKEDSAEIVVADGDSIFVVGETGPYQIGDQVLVARIGPGGAVEWARTFGEIKSSQPWTPIEKPVGAFLDAKGRVVIGTKRWLNDSGGPPWIFAVTREGDIAWEYTEDTEFERGSPWVLLPTKDGGSLVAATLEDGSGGPGPAKVIRLDAEGALLWSLPLEGGPGDQQVVYGAVETESLELVLAGYSQTSGEGHVWWISPEGTIVRSIDYPEAENRVFLHLRAMPGGGYLLGSTTSAGDTEVTGTWHLLRIGSAGDLRWGHDMISDGYARLADIAVRPSGEVIAVGSWTFDDDPIGRVIALEEKCVVAPP